MFILLLGAPGSGKGTQGKILAEHLGLPKITTGDILRGAVQAGSDLGREAKKFMDEGKLVPDSVVLGLIKTELDKPEAKEVLLAYLKQLRTNPNPGPVQPRLAAVYASLDDALQQHLDQLDVKHSNPTAQRQ